MFPRTPDLLNAICNEIKLKEWKDEIKKENKKAAPKSNPTIKVTNKTIIIKTYNKNIFEVKLAHLQGITIDYKNSKIYITYKSNEHIF